jgi:hypothetical protein
MAEDTTLKENMMPKEGESTTMKDSTPTQASILKKNQAEERGTSMELKAQKEGDTTMKAKVQTLKAGRSITMTKQILQRQEDTMLSKKMEGRKFMLMTLAREMKVKMEHQKASNKAKFCKDIPNCLLDKRFLILSDWEIDKYTKMIQISDLGGSQAKVKLEKKGQQTRGLDRQTEGKEGDLKFLSAMKSSRLKLENQNSTEAVFAAMIQVLLEAI